jgi:hypothetical protein
MLNRLLYLNCYSAKQILDLTGQKVERGIICVGNSIIRKAIENKILDHKPVVIVGAANSGKLTAVLEICERHNITRRISYDGSGFGVMPFQSDDVFIIRNPKKNAENKEYINRDLRVCYLFDNPNDNFTNLSPFQLIPPSQADRKHYAELKGMQMNLPESLTKVDSERFLVAKMLKSDVPYTILPPNTHRYYAMNFNTKKGILKVCSIAQNVDDPLMYWGLLSLIKHPRSVELKQPPWLKRNENNNN